MPHGPFVIHDVRRVAGCRLAELKKAPALRKMHGDGTLRRPYPIVFVRAAWHRTRPGGAAGWEDSQVTLSAQAVVNIAREAYFAFRCHNGDHTHWHEGNFW